MVNSVLQVPTPESILHKAEALFSEIARLPVDEATVLAGVLENALDDVPYQHQTKEKMARALEVRHKELGMNCTSAPAKNVEDTAVPALMDLQKIDQNAHFSARSPVDGWTLTGIRDTLDDLLDAACGMQHNRKKGEEDEDLLMTALGRYVQGLRNDLAKELEPVFNAFGVEGPDY